MSLAVVLGGARCVWEDLERLSALAEPDVVVATNDAGAHYRGPLHHWATLHYEKLPAWMAERESRNLPPAENVWVHDRAPAAFQGRRLADWGGSSGLFAVRVALAAGCERVVLCGVPMEMEEAHFFDSRRWGFAGRYRQAWTRHAEEIAASVRSMSGWTAQLLGEPDEVWLSQPRRKADGPEGST